MDEQLYSEYDYLTFSKIFILKLVRDEKIEFNDKIIKINKSRK